MRVVVVVVAPARGAVEVGVCLGASVEGVGVFGGVEGTSSFARQLPGSRSGGASEES